MIDYLRDPAAIYAASFATIHQEADLSRLPKDAMDVAVRIIHACGMVEAANDLVISPDFVAAASKALGDGRPILVDAEMVRHGIIARNLRAKNPIICTLNSEGVAALATRKATTRSAAAVDLWDEHVRDAIAVIGNAPTALFALLEKIEAGGPRPAAIVGFPVGFVGAAESKDALIANAHGIPFAAIRGRKGGSAMAAAVINALAVGVT